MDEGKSRMLGVASDECGFAKASFRDYYGSECAIQDSSLADVEALWLGCWKDFNGEESTAMHLTREIVEQLMPLLQRFLDTGTIRAVTGAGE